jgi:hypothetical protein
MEGFERLRTSGQELGTFPTEPLHHDFMYFVIESSVNRVKPTMFCDVDYYYYY